MKKSELMNLVGMRVRIIFHDNKVEEGVLKYIPEFGCKYGYRKPNYFVINDLSFKVSHTKKVEII